MSVLNAAHAMGVVHRDLKPENIMIGTGTTGGEPVVKLLDLGIAKLREVAGAEKTGTTALTIAGQMLGTPYYMSPEQWGELPRDGNSDIDGRADIYSLGIVFYELIAGARPFKGLTLSELRREHVSVVPTPLHEMLPTVPEGFSRAIARSIAKDRDERQATAGELDKELLAALAAEGISASPTIASVVSSSAAGIAGPRGPITAAERTAPTIVGEAPATGTDHEVSPATPIPSDTGTMPTLVAAEKEVAAGANQSADALVEAVPRSRSPLLFIAAGVVVLLLIVGVGGFAVIHFIGNKANSNTSRTDSSGANGSELTAATHEVGRYWLEVDTKNIADAIRAGDPVAMQSGQKFRFHFSPSQNGYLYIIGPGSNNVSTTFLTANPPEGYGVKTNEVKSGVDFSFPRELWIELDKNPGTDEFTIVFAARAITTPGFFAGAAGHPLSSDELKQWDDFRAQFKANAVVTEVIKTGASPAVSVKIPQTDPEGSPVIFKVRIEHK